MDYYEMFVESAMEMGLTRDEAEREVDEYFDMDFADYLYEIGE